MTADVLAHDRSGPVGRRPLLCLHAGVADRRMWDEIRRSLAPDVDLVAPDLRGFGESDHEPTRSWSHADDVVGLLESLELGPVDVVGASMGAGVAVELALDRPDLVASLLLVAPGGSLIPAMTADLEGFIAAETAALAADDLDAAASANVAWWVVGPHRTPDQVPRGLQDRVHAMQRRAFELTARWPDLETEPDPEPGERLGEVAVPTLVLSGGLDLEAIQQAAELVVRHVPGALSVTWPDVAHLPSMEHPERFVALLREWRSA